MNQLDVLAIGSLVYDENNELREAHSTSTLIRAGDRLIVVDTSSRYMRPAIKTSFRQLGVFMKDVDTVVLTHHHGDHVSNYDFFPNAKVIMHSFGDDACSKSTAEEDNYTKGINKSDELDPFKVATLIDSVREEIAPGVTLVHTPGHTWNSMSVFVKGSDRNYVIAGDAIPTEDNFRKGLPPRINVCKDIALKSMKEIKGFADVIVPGHGLPFIARK